MEINKFSDFLTQKPRGFLIVGLGASAGGIQALRQFFEHVPEDSHMAYVVILHLSPDHDSQLAQVLQAVTILPVTQVTEKVKIEPDHIYVVPPNQHLIMEEDFIVPSVNVYTEERRAPVDIFFRTLADSHGPRAVSVILSGTGANGSMGLKRVKEGGGAAYVQNPREAEFNEMPRNAIATELIDEVLPVAQIPGHIIAYRNSLSTVEIAVEAAQPPEPQLQALRGILTQLRLRTGHDFSNYKRPTLLRRVERRINVRDLPDLPSYAAFLQENIEESSALLKDLLISVTNFFRDKKPFAALEGDVFPALFRDKHSEDEVRIWVAGCATGEEAYSLAMLVAERTIGVLDAPKVQIFATDLDEAAIAAAREGLYTLNDAADVSAERLQRFFKKEGDRYRVIREIREMILFANHNFLKDPPFSRLDLVSCRNVLIYLNASAQERIMETFHFALKPGSYLFLGSAESVDGASDLYATVSRENRIYQARQATIRQYPVPESVPRKLPKQPPAVKPNEGETRPPNRLSFGELHQKLLEQYAPPSLVVNEEYDIVHMSEKVGGFLELSGGEPTKNLLKLVKPDLRLELRSALYQALQGQTAIEARNVGWTNNGQRESVTIHVKPVTKPEDPAKGFLLVLFEPQEPEQNQQKAVLAADETIARQLEEELIGVKAQLRLSDEQHEYQAEELKASNEELQAMNEELRSAAEELETSKEEQQSINEELRTVNQELKVKIEEISITSNNLQNLINSADVATIFLDRAFCTRFYTPAARQIFNLIPSDYGRPISDITHRLENGNLLPDAQTVLEKLTGIEREVMTTDQRAFMMRMLPYRTTEDRINGVVITFFDITLRKQAEKALLGSQQRLRLLIESARDYAILSIDTQRQVVSWSSGAQTMFGYGEADIIGKSGDLIFVPEDRDQKVPEWDAQTAEKEGRAENERLHLRQDGSRFWGSGITRPLSDEEGKTIGFVKIIRDLTEHKQAQEDLRQAEERYRSQLETEVHKRTAELKESRDQYFTLVENTPDVITRWDKALKLVFANSAFKSKTGVPNERLLGKTDHQMGQPDELALPYMNSLRKAFETGETVEHFDAFPTPDGEAWFYSRITPEKNAAGEVETVLATARDITRIRKAEQEIILSRQFLQSVMDSSLDVIQVLDAVREESGKIVDFTWKGINRRGIEQLGEVVGKSVLAQNPGVVSSGVFERMVQVVESGSPYEQEQYYAYEQFAGNWFYLTVVKHDGGVILTTKDITAYKKAEAERLQSLTLLQQSEEVARSGSWEYDIATGSFSWSEGMYRLFGLPIGSPIGLKTYLDYVIEEDRSIAEKFIHTLSTGQEALEETLRIARDGQVLTLKIKAVVMHDQLGQPLKVLGVDLDMSEIKRLEQENLQIRLDQQQQLLEAILEAQEEERRRISESLHNGVGQILYATKLNLARADQEAGPEANPEAAAAILRVDELLTEAIVETRRVSHELVPVLLKEFGLKKAIEEICSRFQGTGGIQLHCHCFAQRIPVPLETALYRISQELLNNIVKHSGASKASLDLNKDHDFIYLEAQDNGKGMQMNQEIDRAAGSRSGQGIGLRTIQDRVALLGGSLEIDAAPGKGTLVAIRFPLHRGAS